MLTPELKAALDRPHPWNLDVHYPNPVYPQGTRNEYSATPHPDGGSVFDNDTAHTHRLIHVGAQPFLSSAGRFAALEFEVAAERPPKSPTDYNGMAAMFVPALKEDRGCYASILKFRANSLQTPWRSLPLEGGLHRITMAIDRKTECGALWVDGNLAASGELRPEPGSPAVYWGDGSSVISGSFRMTFLRAAVWEE